MFKKIGCFMVSLLVVLNIFSYNTYATTETNTKELDKVDQLMCEYKQSLIEDNISRDNATSEKTQRLEKELSNLGVEKISYKEVKEKYNPPCLSKNSVSTRSIDIEKPEDANNVRWKKYIYTRYYNGKYYDVVILWALPDGSMKSPLIDTTTRVSAYEPNIVKAGAKSFIKATLKQGKNACVEAVVNQVPIVGKAITIYDVAKETIDGIRATTYFKDLSTTLRYTVYSDVKFVYVKESNQSDSYTTLELSTSALEGYTGWSMPTNYYDANKDKYIPSEIKGSLNVSCESTHYSNSSAINYALRAYSNNYMSGYAECTSIKTEVLEDETLTLTSQCPHHPGFYL